MHGIQLKIINNQNAIINYCFKIENNNLKQNYSVRFVKL